MKKIRIIPRLDIKGPNVVKGIELEGLRVIGKPYILAKKYYEQGADEIIYLDIVASLYGRDNLLRIVEETASSGIYIPMCVGGGVRTLDDIKTLLRVGADKVAINTAATKNPELIDKAVKKFGSQCIVGSIEAKYIKDNKWEAYINCGRERTNLDVIKWAKKLVKLGVGELLITSIDHDGKKTGYDIELIRRINSQVNVPVIACSGAGNQQDIFNCLKNTKCDAVAVGSILHYNQTSIHSIKSYLHKKKIQTRIEQDFNNLDNNIKNKKTVSIIDYDAGNIKSVISAFRSVGNNVKLVNKKEDILNSELLVLLGDGAFGPAISNLRKEGIAEAVKQYVQSNKPLLGICLGMQLLMTESEEFGNHKGLDIINGKNIKFKFKTRDFRLPHIGWNQIIKPKSADWSDSILCNIPNFSNMYFLHSYCVTPNKKDHILANSVYHDKTFCSVIKKNNIYGTQFHPEKSGRTGIEIIRSFGRL